jgi:hypothetical protein
MTQADRDRLVTLQKAKTRLITQSHAEELKLSVRQVKRLLRALKQVGDKAVIHGSRGKPSNGRIGRMLRSKQWRFCRRRCIRGSGRLWQRST